jgi:hypothetical protein
MVMKMALIFLEMMNLVSSLGKFATFCSSYQLPKLAANRSILSTVFFHAGVTSGRIIYRGIFIITLSAHAA